MATRGKSYEFFKIAFQRGKVTSMRDVQKYICITELSHDMALNYNTLSKRLLAPEKLTIANVMDLARLSDIETSDLFHFISKEIAPIKSLNRDRRLCET